MSLAQNCMRSICKPTNESLLSVPPVHRVHITAHHNKVHLSSIYMHNKNASDKMNKPDTVIFSIKNILLSWTDGGQPWSHLVSLSLCSLCILRPRLYDWPTLLPTLKLPFSFFWGCRSRSFHTLPQPDRLNIINTRGSIQRLSLLLSLVSGPASLHMTVSPCQEQPFSKGLRAVQLAFQGDGCCRTSQPRNQWILTASHFTAE